MKTARRILQEAGLPPPLHGEDRYYSTCPKCSAQRSTAHQKLKCVGITIDQESVRWGCNHCGWTGGEHFRNGKDSDPIVATFVYTDEAGAILSRKHKTAAKNFWQDRPDGRGGWISKTTGVRKVLYRLPELIEDIANDHLILIVEGEKDVENLRRLGIPATCNPEGASEPGKKPKWQAEYSEALRNADIIIIPDHDPAGYAHADAIAELSNGIAKSIRILKLIDHWPECPEHGDVSDWIAKGHTREQLDDLIAKAKPWAPSVADHHQQDARPPEFSDEALALRFANLHADDLRYVAAWNKWLIWSGTHWQFDDTLAAYSLVRIVCRGAAAQCNKLKTASALASAKTVAAIANLSRSDRRLAATVDQWDTDPWLLNTPDGVIDMRTGKLRAHSAFDYMTKITTVALDQKCATPIWRAFLKKITNNDSDLIAFLQRMAGYALSGSTKEHALFFLYGVGANGKSTFINAITGIAGDYHTTAPIETFTTSMQERHPTDLAGLRGARLVTAIETEEGRRWAESKIKTLTGGDKIAARFMRQDFFEFVPSFKLVIAGNHKPGLRSVDEAIRRRFHLVPFNVTIPPAERDAELGNRLRAEWPGILAWMTEGCINWLKDGLAPPQAVTDATTAYLEAEDAIAAWLEEAGDEDPNAWEKSSDLFASWVEWATKAGEFVGSQKRFCQNLETRLQFERRNYGRGFRGLRLLPKEYGNRESQHFWDK